MRKFTAKIISLVLFAVLLMTMTVPLSSCADKGLASETSFDWFDTVTSVTAPKDEIEEIWKISEDILGKYDRLFDIYNEYDGINNLCTVNKNAGKESVTLDSETFELLSYAKKAHVSTNGKVNVMMGSVLKIWHSYRTSGLEDPENASLPPSEALEEAAKHTDIDLLDLNEQTLEVYIKDEKASLDVGAIAKGFAVERLADALYDAGFKSFLINAGGNVRAIGAKPDGELWRVGISDPSGKKSYVRVAEISDTSMVTSGSYQRFYTVDGKEYHHIIDPETLMPSKYFASVSVCMADSGTSDVLSTALFLVSENEGRELCESLGAEALWIYEDGKTSQTEGFPK